MPYAVDLFCGAGGCSEGLIQAGFHILFSSDISDMVEKTYVNRHKQLGLIQGKNTWFERSDIKNLTGDKIRECIASLEIFQGKSVPNIDLMIGGPSCQGFSRAGKRDKSDPRNMLFGEYVRVINEIKPSYIILENVEGFMDMEFLGYKGITGIEYEDGSVTPTILRSELEQIGYETLEPQILNAADYGVPQRRHRVIFIGYKKGLPAPSYPAPTCKKQLTVLDAIGDLISDKEIKLKVNPKETKYQKESKKGRTPTIQGKPISSKGIITNYEFSNLSDVVKERFSLYNEGETSSNLKKRIINEGIDLSNYPALTESVTSSVEGFVVDLDTINYFKAAPNKQDISHIQEYVKYLSLLLTKKNIRTRLNSNEPSPTVVTLPDDYISPWEDRTFSVREMARLQSFDDSFQFLGKRTTGGKKRRTEVPQFTQVGNAVPPLLAKAVALEILKVLPTKK